MLALMGLPTFGSPIGVAKAAGPGWSGQIQGIVTAIFLDYNSFVVEEENRSAAITVKPLPPRDLRIGDEVQVTGTVQSDLTFLMQAIQHTGRRYVPVRPLGLSNKSVTGAVGNPGLSNMDLLVRVWGRILDEPSPFADGSTVFHITDGSAREQPINFLDNFDSGRRPEWVDFVGTTSVQGGKLVAGSAQNVVCATTLSIRDVRVDVDAGAGVQMGIVLRYQDNNNYVLAFFAPTQGQGPVLGFHERLNGNFGPWLNPVPAPGLSGTVHMTVQAAGPNATVSIADGSHSYSTSCSLTTLLGPGLVGLYHDTSTGPAAAYFDNFLASSPVVRDSVRVVLPPSFPGDAPGGLGDFVGITGIAGADSVFGESMRRVTMIPETFVVKGFFPPVVVALDGTGDFGPETPGTLTCGIQEAINYCVANDRDLYIKGGWLGPVYNIADTIRIPPAENFKIDGGMYVLNWVGPTDKDMLVFNSCKNCDFKFGLLVYGGQQASIRVKPQNQLPGGGQIIFTDNRMRFECATDPNPFSPGPRTGLGAVVFDTSAGSIVYNDIYFVAVINFATDMMTTGAQSFSGNRLWCAHLHTNATQSTLLKLSSQTRQNEFYLAMGVDQGATGVTGIDVEGANNVFNLIIRNGFDSPRALVLEPAASGNVINISALPGVDPFSLVTDLATNPTNRVTYAGSSVGARTIAAEAGIFTYTQRLYPAQVTVSGGVVSSISLVRGAASVDYTGQGTEGILLSAGDQLVVASTVAPTLKVVPLKCK